MFFDTSIGHHLMGICGQCQALWCCSGSAELIQGLEGARAFGWLEAALPLLATRGLLLKSTANPMEALKGPRPPVGGKPEEELCQGCPPPWTFMEIYHCNCILVHKVKVLVAQLCLTLCDPSQACLSMEFSKQEDRNGFPFSSPGDLPDPGIEPRSKLHCRQTLYHLSHRHCIVSGPMPSELANQLATGPDG